MKIVDSTLMLRKFVDADDGVLVEPVAVASGASLSDVHFLKSFKNLTLGDGATLSEVNYVKSFHGLVVGSNCSITGLTSVESLDGLIAGEYLELSGLNFMRSFGRPILRRGVKLSWLDRLDNIDFNSVMWPKDVVLYGVSRELAKLMPSLLNDKVLLEVAL